MNGFGGQCPVDAPVVLFKDGSPGGASTILGYWINGPLSEAIQGFQQDLCAFLRQTRREFGRRFVRRDFGFPLEQDVARIETRVDTHRGDTGLFVTARYRPLDGRRAPQ